MFLTLRVLPPPFSTSIFPELSRVQRREWRQAMRGRYKACFWCGKPLPRKSHSTLDHFIPLDKGGTNTADNFRLACSYCNSVKGNLWPVEWLARLESVVDHLRVVVPTLS